MAFFVVELVGGILTNSLALLADAGHMLSDVARPGIEPAGPALDRPAAPRPKRPSATTAWKSWWPWSTGWCSGPWPAISFMRPWAGCFQPPAISGSPLIIIASLGLMVNLFGMYVLMPTREHNINLRSAFIHLLSDSFASFAAVVAGLAIWWQGWYWFDPLAGVIVGVMIVISSWQLVWEAAEILMESTPRHIDLDEVQQSLESHPQVKQVHDLHIWTIASGIYALSVHVTIDNPSDRDCLTWELEELLRHRFGLEHNTIQIEGPDFHDPQACPLHRLNGGHP